MTEPGVPTLLAHPALAFFLAVVAIGAAAALLLRAAWRVPAASRAAWWRPLSLLSEVLLALGLIGLGVFGGRITLAANQVLLAGQVASARDAVDARLVQVEGDYCTAAHSAAPAAPAVPPARGAKAGGAALPPFGPNVAARELCEIASARVHDAPAASLAQWQVTSGALRDFGARYPGCVDNVFSRNNDCENTVKAASKLAFEVDTLTGAMLAAREQGAALAAVHGERDWGFALLALFLACASMAIRIARAAANWLPAARP
jgi:hypothetical protein